MTFGEFIKEKRIDKRKTLAKLAGEMGWSSQYQSQLEHGRAYISPQRATDLLKVLVVSESETDLALGMRCEKFESIKIKTPRDLGARIMLAKIQQKVSEDTQKDDLLIIFKEILQAGTGE